jgi:hypothetical protein
MDSDDYLVSAALLRRGQGTSALVADLADRLEHALPDHVTVERSGWGRRRKISSLAVTLDPERFRIALDSRGPTAWIDQVVRGICLRSDPTGLDQWLDRLAGSLSKEAAKSVEVRLALESALG